IGICIRDRIIGRHSTWRWKSDATAGSRPFAASKAGEDHHVRYACLKARRVVREIEDRARRTEAENPDAGPNKNGAGKAIAPRRYEYDTLTRRVPRFVDCCLNRTAVVGLSVTA